MFKLNLFDVGLIVMFVFVLSSNVLNYVSIATTQWLDPNSGATSIWTDCNYPSLETGNVDRGNAYRAKCFKEVPPALIATGTALNALSLILMAVSLLALFLKKFRNTFALYFVIGSEICTLLGMLFRSLGIYFIVSLDYQKIFNFANTPLSNPKGITPGFVFGWSFWLMIASMGLSVIAAIVGSSILGCTCAANKPNSIEQRQMGQTVLPVQNQYLARQRNSDSDMVSIKREMMIESRMVINPSVQEEEMDQEFRL